jgi:uncharacterized protein DUF7002
VELIELKRAVRLAWHSTFAGGWDRIRESDFGLASTSALLDRCGIAGERRQRLECVPRPTSELLEGDGLPPVVIRDQKPLLPVHLLERVLDGGGMTVREWCLDLNRRVFFFTSDRPLKRLLRAYGDQDHDVLVVDARKLVDRYEPFVELSPINTGAIQPAYAKRGRGTFLPIADYPSRPSGAPARSVAEITVTTSLPDIEDLVVRVERWRGPARFDGTP